MKFNELPKTRFHQSARYFPEAGVPKVATLPRIAEGTRGRGPRVPERAGPVVVGDGDERLGPERPRRRNKSHARDLSQAWCSASSSARRQDVS